MLHRHRDRGTGGGASGATCPHNFKAVGAPPTLDRECLSFAFIFAREIESLPKNSGPNMGSLVLVRGYFEPQGRLPPIFKVVPAPLHRRLVWPLAEGLFSSKKLLQITPLSTNFMRKRGGLLQLDEYSFSRTALKDQRSFQARVTAYW